MTNIETFEPDREMYDHADIHTPKYTAQPGLNEELSEKYQKTKTNLSGC